MIEQLKFPFRYDFKHWNGHVEEFATPQELNRFLHLQVIDWQKVLKILEESFDSQNDLKRFEAVDALISNPLDPSATHLNPNTLASIVHKTYPLFGELLIGSRSPQGQALRDFDDLVKGDGYVALEALRINTDFATGTRIPALEKPENQTENSWGRIFGILTRLGLLTFGSDSSGLLSSFKSDWAGLRDEVEAQLQEKTDRFIALEQQFERMVATKAAQKYWEDRARYARWYTLALTAGSLAWAGFGVWIGIDFGLDFLGTIELVSEDRMYGLLLKLSIAALPVAVYWAGLRTLVRMLVFQVLIGNDAKERSTMVQTFEALSEAEFQRDRPIDPALLEKVIERLTRPSVTGLTKHETVGPLSIDISGLNQNKTAP
ncbi:MAG: hypothetical protein AAGF84_03935 [Planctomycetota bacterium]